MQDNINIQNHEIVLDNRKILSVSGVEECLSFDEETILLKTKLGRLTIKGEKLHIQNYNTQTGELTADGKIIALGYSNEDFKKGLLSKIFK